METDTSFNILVIGDLIEDHYIDYYVERTAPEASNAPVLDILRSTFIPGGAANVYENIKSLRGVRPIRSHLFGIGDQEKFGLWAYQAPSMKKTRLVDSEGKISARIDNFKKFPDKVIESFQNRFIDDMREFRRINALEAPLYDAVVVCDYDKGTVTEKIIKSLFEFNVAPLKIVDSKRKDLRIFEGFDILKLNADEHSVQLGSQLYETSFERLFKHVVITQGGSPVIHKQYERGDRYGQYKIHSEYFDVENVEPVDVTGCGDTFVSALTISYLESEDIRSAIRFANKAASVKVKKFGTSTVTRKEMTT